MIESPYKSLCVARDNTEVPMPKRSTSGAAGYDLTNTEPVYLSATRCQQVVGTGLRIKLPPKHVGLVCSRSGLAAKHGVFVLNSPGVIDEDYEGELKIILCRIFDNALWPDNEVFVLPPGSRIAQLMVLELPNIILTEAAASTFMVSSQRGEGGLGSTGT